VKRSLALKKDTLAELATDELSGVVGGSVSPTCYTCVQCYVDRVTEAIALPKVTSVNAQCQTG
jgi:hypothetical protein